MSEFISAGLRMLLEAKLADSATRFIDGPSLDNGLYADLALTQYFQLGTHARRQRGEDPYSKSH